MLTTTSSYAIQPQRININMHQRWMLFVDGENLTIRGRAVASDAGISLFDSQYYLKDHFVWFPSRDARSAPRQNRSCGLSDSLALRALYYTSVSGGHENEGEVKRRLRDLQFHPVLFRKKAQKEKAKGVDIALTTEMLANVFRGNFDTAVLIAGDADYVPLVEEVKHLGKRVQVWFFESSAAGALVEVSDEFWDITPTFHHAWRSFIQAEQQKAKQKKD